MKISLCVRLRVDCLVTSQNACTPTFDQFKRLTRFRLQPSNVREFQSFANVVSNHLLPPAALYYGFRLFLSASLFSQPNPIPRQCQFQNPSAQTKSKSKWLTNQQPQFKHLDNCLSVTKRFQLSRWKAEENRKVRNTKHGSIKHLRLRMK